MIWLIGLGGVFGTLSRFYLGIWISGKTKSGFPWGTWVINLTGSFVLGALFTLHTRLIISDMIWQVIGTGFCGGYTTFSTFGYETSQLMQRGEQTLAWAYVVFSIIGGLVFAFLGIEMMKSIL